ncbi:LysR substrate-binding domain-containing protein [Alloyangia pacifica]|uniref:LysR substrate-binding domain-containing protein n=1 Tax=Alloyangia pacifica TaxID=311180 RepID=UPI001CD3EB08|nr:hypothetical protein [Alloyangia pacifica]
MLAPPLAAAFARHAPEAELEIAPIGPDLDPRFLAGQSFDLAIGRFSPPPEDLVVSELFNDGFRCIVAPEALADGATLDRVRQKSSPRSSVRAEWVSAPTEM